MKRYVGIENWKSKTRIGVTEEEKRVWQPIIISVRIELTNTALKDQIENTVNYDEVICLFSQCLQMHIFSLIETLADYLANLILENTAATTVWLCVKKPKAAAEAEYAYTIVEMEREKLP